MEYFLKFKNFQEHPEGTGRLHYRTLQKHGKVLWGQWRKGKSLLSENTKTEMNNNAPFILNVLDKEVALLRLTVEHVYSREEVIEEHLEYLIPNYYDIDTPCSAYYLVSAIDILSSLEAMNIVNINTGRSVYQSGQINSAAPWRVHWANNNSTEAIGDEEEKHEQYSQVDGESYWVYRYHSISLNKNYIGMTNNLIRRRREHESPLTWKREKKKFLYVLMNMLGLKDFEFEVLHEDLTEEEAHHMEAVEIENYDAYFPNGLNERVEKRFLQFEI